MMIAINNRLKKLMGRYRRSQDGVTAIEFALVGGPFLFVLLVTFELGLMLFAEYALAQNVETAGRLIRTGQIQNGQNGHQATPEYFKSQICKSMTFLNCQTNLYVDVRKFNTFSDIAGNLPAPFKPGTSELSNQITSGTQFQTGGAGEIVSIRVYYKWQLSVPGISKLLGVFGVGLGNVSEHAGSGKNARLLTAAATFRNEPFN